jgi:hypothetical protein
MGNSSDNSADKLTANPKFFHLMARMPEFAYLGTDALNRLCLLKPSIFKIGEVLLDCSAADRNNMVILLAGVCNIEKSIDVGGTSARICVNKVHAPAVFGEVGVFASRSRVATVVAAQRVVGLIVSEEELIEIFGDAEEAFNNTLWSFAKLGLLRCRITAEKYSAVTDRIFRRNVIDHSAIDARILKLETHSKSARDDVKPTKSLFNETGDCLEWLDNALALATYFDLMSDFTFPTLEPGDDMSGISISPLGKEALVNGEAGSSVKLKLIEIVLERAKGHVVYENQVEFLSEIVEAVHDLAGFAGMLPEPAK